LATIISNSLFVYTPLARIDSEKATGPRDEFIRAKRREGESKSYGPLRNIQYHVLPESHLKFLNFRVMEVIGVHCLRRLAQNHMQQTEGISNLLTLEGGQK
jgi:hypothetical protein